MRDSTVQSVEMLLRADGADDETVRSVLARIRGPEMVTIRTACERLAVSRWTVIRAINANKIEKRVRYGSVGSLVDFSALQRAIDKVN